MPSTDPPQQQLTLYQCANHSLLEKMFEKGLANLDDRLESIASTLAEQTSSLKETLNSLIEALAQMREASAVRAEQVKALQISDDAQWKRINSNSAKINWLLGLVAVAQIVLIAICTALYKHVIP